MNFLQITSKMEKQVLLIIVIIIFMNSCRKEYYDTFSVENKTDKKVIIEGYTVKWSNSINRETIYKETIEIQPNSLYSVKKGNGESWQPKGIFETASMIDSVNIIFNNQRIILYSCSEIDYLLCNDKKNILNYQEYYDKQCGEHSCTYVYSITNEDYDTAEVIN
jgi:hypothetical protein